MIHFDPEKKTFFLETPRTSYLIFIGPDDTLLHLYYGKRVARQDAAFLAPVRERPFSPMVPGYTMAHPFSLDALPQEYPTYGMSDFRTPALHVQYPDGSRLTDLRYISHRLLSGKPERRPLPGLLSSGDDAQTLEITLRDGRGLLEVTLSYTVFDDLDGISRCARVTNVGAEDLRLQKAASFSFDLPDKDFELIQLYGAWARERNVERLPLSHGSHTVQSLRGSSSHQAAPFLALRRPDAGEETGEVYGVTLIYSGSFALSADVDQYDTTRVMGGVQPFDFSWLLEPGASFETPEALLVFSDEGLGGMSRSFHRACRQRLGKSKYRDRVKPVILNSWEGLYYRFDAEKLKQTIERAAGMGIDIFVVDDGWFGKRDDDTNSLGDWTPDPAKFPDGLAPVIETCHRCGMQFGIWFEPEMISEDSDLYRAHPDWCLHVPGVGHCTSRNQLVLDLSRADVVDYLEQTVGAVLEANDIVYVKWDMNRNITNVGSALLPAERQDEVRHRYILGLYDLMDRLTTRFPDVLFEGCSGGGGRLDFGILYYMPQFWTSDDSDAICRLKIQYGTSLFVPPCAMVGHVTAVPNHQCGRTTSLQTRADVAAFCNFGYELDPASFDEAARAAVRAQVARQQKIAPLVLDGAFYRLRDPFAGDDAAWMLVSPDRREAVAVYVKMLATPNPPCVYLRLRGLDPAARYHIDELDRTVGGDLLMSAGLPMPERGDFHSTFLTLHRVD